MPRNSSRRKLGSLQPFCREASATFKDGVLKGEAGFYKDGKEGGTHGFTLKRKED